jgi:hypothetical protein
MRRSLALITAAAITAAACSDSQPDGQASSVSITASTAATTASSAATTTPEAAPQPTEADPATIAAVQAAVDAGGPSCDPLDTTRCLLPFPSDAYRIDGRVSLAAEAMPANASGVVIDPAEWNRNDGFSTNTPILTFVPGLDAEASALPPWTDLEQSLQPQAPVVLIDIATGERVPLWAELDAKAARDDDRLLEIHPAVPLAHATTYAVALRGLVDESGAAIEAGPVFRAYRDRLRIGIDGIERRRAEMDAALDALADADVPRAELQLAWTFTTASADNVTGRMEHIRDTALAELGDDQSPAFTVTEVTANTDDNIAVQVRGTYTVPNFLEGDGGPGNRFHYDGTVAPDRLPSPNSANPTLQAPFVCNVSVATANGIEPAHLVQYGHGLLGSNDEIDAGNVRAFANEHNVVFCATKWAGMSEDDIGNAAATLGEISNFPTVADRLQQGVLNQIFLGRLMTRPNGLVSHPAFRRADGTALIDTAHLDYDGNSQGAIMGLMLTAVSPDIERSVLGVAGMNYSVLLSRSVDFDTYEAVFEPAYPNDLDRVMIIALMQMLWDRGEGAGYVHMVDTPVLIHVAFGDWQVSEITAMIEARALDATIHRPVTTAGRSGEVQPGWGLDTTAYPSTDGRAALVVWDSGSDPIPFENVPPRTSRDSHEDPRADADVRRQKAAWLFEDTLIDVCDGQPCTADARD